MGPAFTKKYTVITNCVDESSSTGYDNSSGERNIRDWPLMSSDSIDTWKYSSVLYGFEPRIDYNSNIKSRLAPWTTFGRYFSVSIKYDTIEKEDRYFIPVIIDEVCFKSQTCVRLPRSYHSRFHSEPEPSFHYLKTINVVGYRNGVCILQINCQDCMEFVVVHMKTSTILGIHKEEIHGFKHYLCDCLISPNLSTFILKPNAMYVLNFCRDNFNNSVKVVSCKGNPMPVLKESLFPSQSVRPFMAYDPRYTWRRIAIGNYFKNGRDTLVLYDLLMEKVLQTADPYSHYQTTHNITWSSDGSYIASLILGRSIKDGLFNFPRVLVYDSNDLTIIQSINTNCLQEVATLSPNAIFPLFNNTGTLLAIPYGFTPCDLSSSSSSTSYSSYYQQLAGVNVYKAPNVMDLQSLCRLIIRQYFETYDVDKLPLPKKLKDYLKFKPFCE